VGAVRQVRVTELLRCPQYKPIPQMDEYQLYGLVAHAVIESRMPVHCVREPELRVRLDINDEEIEIIGHPDVICGSTIYEIKPYPKLTNQLKVFSRQLLIYGNMYRRLYFETPRLILIFYKVAMEGVAVEKQEVFYEDVWNWLTTWIRNYVHLTEKGKLYIRTYLCSSCELRKECPLSTVYRDKKVLFMARGE
jgi:hypothetical protein